MSEEKQKFYSTDDESFNFESIGELMDELDGEGSLEEGRVYYEGEGERVSVETVVTAHTVDHLLENIDENLYEELGECYSNDFSDVTAEEREELRNLIVEWAKKHVRIQRYWKMVGRSEEKRFTKEEVQEYYA